MLMINVLLPPHCCPGFPGPWRLGTELRPAQRCYVCHQGHVLCQPPPIWLPMRMQKTHHLLGVYLFYFFFNFILFYFFIFFFCCFLFFGFFCFFFKFYFIFKLYITVLDLPNIKMNPPQVYMGFNLIVRIWFAIWCNFLLTTVLQDEYSHPFYR